MICWNCVHCLVLRSTNQRAPLLRRYARQDLLFCAANIVVLDRTTPVYEAMSDTENSTDNRPFARPFGGVPVQYDFAITLLFGIGFAVAFGIDIYTICRKKTRTLSKALTANVSFERMFSFTLRMAQALLFDFRESHGINEYLQASFSVGFITLMQEQLYLILCAATSASRDGLSYQEWQRAVEKNPGIKDARKDEREKIRNSSRLLDLCIVVIQGLQVTISVLAVITKSNRGATWMLYFR